MPWITEQDAIDRQRDEEKLARMTLQLDALVDALDDVLLVFSSGATDSIKLMRIEDLLASGADEERIHGQRDPIAIVGRSNALPHRAWNHAEHASTIETEGAVSQNVKFQITQLHVACLKCVRGNSSFRAHHQFPYRSVRVLLAIRDFTRERFECALAVRTAHGSL